MAGRLRPAVAVWASTTALIGLEDVSVLPPACGPRLAAFIVEELGGMAPGTAAFGPNAV